MQGKILIISHGSDCDGAMPVILTNLVYKNVTSIFLEANETDQKVIELLNDDEYDYIYMTDLGVSSETCDKIMNSKIKDKFKIFDHHISRKEISKYPFVTLLDSSDGQKQCGTTIYYEYLKTICDNPILDKKVVKDIIELIRQIDTWDWVKTNNIDAKKIGDLFNIIGRENFISDITKRIIECNTFSFTKEEEYLLNVEEDKIKRYIDEKKENMIKAVIDNHKVGVIFAERYRSELGSVLSNEFANILDFIIIINLDKSVSYRSIGEEDVSLFASKYGGGGHKNASGSPIDRNILNKVITLLFDKVEFKDED